MNLRPANISAIELNGIDNAPINGQMEFDHYVYTWTSSDRRNQEADVCVTVRDADIGAVTMVELWFKEDSGTLSEVCIVTVHKKYLLSSPPILPERKGLIIANQNILGPRPEREYVLPDKTTISTLDHCVSGYIKRPVAVALSKTEVEIDFGGIRDSTQAIIGPDIIQYTKGETLLGLRFRNLKEVNYQNS